MRRNNKFMPAPKSISLTAHLRRVKLFLTDVDGVLPPRPAGTVSTIDSHTACSERQRRSVLQPRVGAQRLPWVGRHKLNNPEGVAACRRTTLQPFQGCDILGSQTQGSLRGRQPWAECLNAVGVPRTGMPRSMFGVQCWMFDVSHFIRHARA